MASRRPNAFPITACLLLSGLFFSPGVSSGQMRDSSGDALAATELNRLWDDLIVDADAVRPYRAIGTLVRYPRQAAALFKQRLKAVDRPDAAQIRHLIGDLDSTRFAVRERGTEELERLGELAESALRTALDDRPSLEVRQRIEQILAKLDGPLTGEPLRTWRAIEVLGKIGTVDAQEVLQSLAGGAADARLTRDARDTLDRLPKHRPFAKR